MPVLTFDPDIESQVSRPQDYSRFEDRMLVWNRKRRRDDKNVKSMFELMFSENYQNNQRTFFMTLFLFSVTIF